MSFEETLRKQVAKALREVMPVILAEQGLIKTEPVKNDLLSIREAAQILGYSLNYLRVLLKRDDCQIPHFQPSGPGGKYQFSRKQLEEYRDSKKGKSLTDRIDEQLERLA